MKADISAFCEYLDEQIGQCYIWGGQGTLLTPSNYKTVIAKREKDATNRAKVERFCEDKFADGATELRGYDCSGLGMYYLQNLTHALPHDLSANGMMGLCEPTETPKRGDWLFRVNEDGKATHIGYMVTDTELIEARGRAYGVVRRKYKQSDWHKVGRPNCMDWSNPSEQEQTEPAEQPEPTELIKVIKVKGHVKVRTGNGTFSKRIGTAADCELPYLGQAQSYPNWYMTVFNGQDGYISSNPKYTELIKKEV